MANERPLMRMRQVSRRFHLRDGEVAALIDVDCAIAAGDRIAVVGPSGSGKSTLLAMIARLDEPTSGSIDWPAFGASADLRPAHIGVAFQTPSLLPALSIVENVELPLLILGRAGEARAAAMTALSRLELAALAERLPEEISGGQAQRVALARAMVSRPGLLLADEPTGQLDQATGQAVIRGLIEQAEATGTALVVATHDPAIARQMNILWHMDHGRLETAQRLRAVS